MYVLMIKRGAPSSHSFVSCHSDAIRKCVEYWHPPLSFYKDQLSFSSVTSMTLRSPLLKPTKRRLPRVFQAIEVT